MADLKAAWAAYRSAVLAEDAARTVYRQACEERSRTPESDATIRSTNVALIHALGAKAEARAVLDEAILESAQQAAP